MTINSKQKGKRGELEVAELLRSHGFEARRGQQFQGGPGSPDVVHSIPGVHIEVKRVETFNAYKALGQAVEDRNEWETPVVFHRRKREPWVVVLFADDYLNLLNELKMAKRGANREKC